MKPIKVCKVCFKEIKNGSYHDFLNNGVICYNCLNLLEPKFIDFEVEGYQALSIFEYSDFVKSKIYQYKGCGDYELANIFVAPFAIELRFLYRGYEIVAAPSHKKENHVIDMFKSLKLPIHDLFFKDECKKQSSLNYKNRIEVHKYIHLKNQNFNLKGKKLLLVDDVFTTGSTIKACLHLLKTLEPEEIKILVIAKTNFVINDDLLHKN